MPKNTVSPGDFARPADIVRRFRGSVTMGTRVEDDDKSNGAMKLLLAVIIVAALLSRRWVARSLLPAVKREQRTNNEAGPSSLP